MTCFALPDTTGPALLLIVPVLAFLFFIAIIKFSCVLCEFMVDFVVKHFLQLVISNGCK